MSTAASAPPLSRPPFAWGQFYKAKRAAMSAGALGFSISGAGPSVFALCEGEETARKVGEAVSKVFSSVPLGNQIHVSRINPHGVHVVDEKSAG